MGKSLSKTLIVGEGYLFLYSSTIKKIWFRSFSPTFSVWIGKKYSFSIFPANHRLAGTDKLLHSSFISKNISSGSLSLTNPVG
jgi:hypothetical protein